MPKFKVLLHQYVQEIAEMEIEAATAQEARDIALKDASEAIWQEGDDSYSVECYGVKDAAGLDALPMELIR